MDRQNMDRSIDADRKATLSGRTEALISAGRVMAARPLLAALRRADADDPALDILQARLLSREGRVAEAIDHLDDAVARHADDVALLLCRSELLLGVGEVNRAAGDAAAAVIADRRDPRAKAALGIVLLRMERFEEALRCIAEAVADAPDHPGFRLALAEAQERTHDPDGAARTLEEAIARWPAALAPRTAAIMLAMRQHALPRVVALAEAACRDGVADATVFGLLGHARSSLGEHDAAAEAYAEALKLAPEDATVRHLVAASGARPTDGRAPAAYVEKLFDGCADQFESHLVSLKYRIPGLLRAALLRHRPCLADPGLADPGVTDPGVTGPGPADLGDVLDLGCGTGFMGVVLSDLKIRRLVGVDLSARMLAIAAAKGIYAELRHGDIAAASATGDDTWDIVVAADVLTYFGALDTVFAAIRQRLRHGGLLLFSLEALQAPPADASAERCLEAGPEVDANWRLHRQGRFSHRAGYVRDALRDAGFVAREMESDTLRLEGGIPVDGLIVVAELPLA
jgi:predicted TPR repeat methyltransferase